VADYFTDREELLVRQYLRTRDEKFYTEHIDPLLLKVAHGIKKKYNFKPKSIFNCDSVVYGCRSLLWEKLTTNFDSNAKKKAFSYLSTVAQNYYFGVWRAYNRNAKKLWKFHLEVDNTWNNHIHITPREHEIIELENQKLIKGFVRDRLGIQEKTISDVEALSGRAHKKNVLEILRKNLRLNTKQIRRKYGKRKEEYLNFRRVLNS